MTSRIEPSQADQQQQIDDLLELERQREIQLQDTQAQNDLAVRRADETRIQDQSNDSRSATAVTGTSDQQARGVDWSSFAGTADTNVPQSVQDIYDQTRRIEQSNSAGEAAKDDANREAMQRETQQRLTIAEIQAEATKKSGIVRG